MAKRPAQGNNSNRPFNRARPAYKPSMAPSVKDVGTESRPTPNRWPSSTGKRKDADSVTPKVTAL